MQDHQPPTSLKGRARARPSPAHAPRDHVDIRELVGPHRRITISHAGEDYTLRITRNGKLILTK